MRRYIAGLVAGVLLSSNASAVDEICTVELMNSVEKSPKVMKIENLKEIDYFIVHESP